jgi:hypothetical protein
MTIRAVQDSIRSSTHVHACPRTSSQSISQLSSGGKPGGGRCQQDQFAEPQADHEFDRRIALRTHCILLQIGGSPFPIVSIPVPLYAKRLRHAGAPDSRFTKQTHFTFRGPESPDGPSSARRPTFKAQVVVASIDVAHGSNVAPQGRMLQNKPNLSSQGLAV